MPNDNSMATDNELFDWVLYGTLIRYRRTKLGYKKAELFSQTLWRRTRVYLSRDMLYKIEQGRQIPNALQFMALNLALYGLMFPEDVLQQCMSPEFRTLATAYKETATPENPWVPIKWARQNVLEAIPDQSELDLQSHDDYVVASKEAAEKTKDTPVLFYITNVSNEEELPPDHK